MTERFTVRLWLDDETLEALDQLARARRYDRDRTVERLLEIHPLIERNRKMLRGEPVEMAQSSRPIEELRALAREARRRWKAREAAGEVRFLDREDDRDEEE